MVFMLGRLLGTFFARVRYWRCYRRESSRRWIKQRAEALLQLRAIEINGYRNKFIAFVHTPVLETQQTEFDIARRLGNRPSPIPNIVLN